MVETKITWSDGMVFTAIPDSGHKVIMDSIKEIGGSAKGPTPMELVLIALGGCSGMDTVSILKKMGVELKSLEIELYGEREEKHPKVYRSIDMKYTVQGKGVPEKNVKRAIELSKNKYCSVSAMLSKKCKIRYTYEIVEV